MSLLFSLFFSSFWNFLLQKYNHHCLINVHFHMTQYNFSNKIISATFDCLISKMLMLSGKMHQKSFSKFKSEKQSMIHLQFINIYSQLRLPICHWCCNSPIIPFLALVVKKFNPLILIQYCMSQSSIFCIKQPSFSLTIHDISGINRQMIYSDAEEISDSWLCCHIFPSNSTYQSISQHPSESPRQYPPDAVSAMS